MTSLGLYLRGFFGLVERIGGPLGFLIILLSLPGIIALVSSGDWAHGLPWLPAAVAAFSSLLLILGVILLWHGVRRALLFNPLARLWFRYRR